MKKTHWFKSVLTLGLLMPLLAIPQGELAHTAGGGGALVTAAFRTVKGIAHIRNVRGVPV